MAHVELSLSDAFAPRGSAPVPGPDSFGRWAVAVAQASEPCLLIDDRMNIAAVSQAACHLLGLSSPSYVMGRPLLDGTLRLLDFTAARAELPAQDVEKIPPLLALTSGRLARGLLRVATTGLTGETDATVDAISTPVSSAGQVAGSLTFFSEV